LIPLSNSIIIDGRNITCLKGGENLRGGFTPSLFYSLQGESLRVNPSPADKILGSIDAPGWRGARGEVFR